MEEEERRRIDLPLKGLRGEIDTFTSRCNVTSDPTASRCPLLAPGLSLLSQHSVMTTGHPKRAERPPSSPLHLPITSHHITRVEVYTAGTVFSCKRILAFMARST